MAIQQDSHTVERGFKRFLCVKEVVVADEPCRFVERDQRVRNASDRRGACNARRASWMARMAWRL